jgi:hypothetical protein
MNSFQVGEIAIVVAPNFEGDEVEVIGSLGYRHWHCALSNDPREGVSYLVRHPSYSHFVVRPEYLRKKRPPQDWNTLCRLADASIASDDPLALAYESY